MKIFIETLKEQHPNLQYEDGFLYTDPDNDGYMIHNGVALDGKYLISEFFEGRELPENPNEVDPTKMNYTPVSGREYIKVIYRDDFQEALKEI